MRRWAQEIIKRRRRVIGVWILVLIVGGSLAKTTTDRLTVDFSLPGQPGDTTSQAVVATFGTAGEDSSPLIVAVTLPNGQQVAQHTAELRTAFDAVKGVRMYGVPLQVFDAFNATDADERHPGAFVTADGTTALAYVFYPLPRTATPVPPSAGVQAAIQPLLPAGAHLGLTGTDALAVSKGSGVGLGVLIELLIATIGALVVLAFVFGSFLALLPMVVAAVSIPATFLLLLPLTHLSTYSFIVQYLISLVGLGLGIDYSLLYITRWREERQRGRENHEAIVAAMTTAGRSVMMSGTTVAIGLLSLIVLPVPFMRSIGIAGALIPLVTVIATITLTPAILATIGPKVDWPRIRNENRPSPGWRRWTAGVVRRRWIATGVSVAALAALVSAFFGANIGFSSAASLAQSGSAYQTLAALKAQHIEVGVLTPIEVLTYRDKATDVAAQLARIDGVAQVAVADASDEHLNRPLNGTGPAVTMVLAFPHEQTVNSRSVAVVDRVQRASRSMDGVVGVTGVGTAQTDFQHAIYTPFPLVLAVLSLLTFVLLARGFRSVLLALKAVTMNFLSLAAAIGAMVGWWQYGIGSEPIYGIAATGAIAVWIPPMAFAFLFGLSMDYEVFILARIREEYDRHGSTDTAIVDGMARTGRLVTSAALILFLAFAAMSTGPGTDTKVLASGLGVGILLDATLIRSLLLPATVSLFGRWNWHLPTRARRMLLLKPAESPAPETLVLD